jgi:uncharacterized protein
MRRTETLSIDEARRIALAAQGFASPRPTGAIDRRHARKVFEQIGVIQVDSVNVLVRSQELPLFARLGPHRRDLLPSMVHSGELFEYWGHMASLMPVEMQPWHRFKMARAHQWTGLRFDDKPGYLDAVLAEIRERGPLLASELTGAGRKNGPWWGWTDGKRALEALFWQGTVSARRRANTFEREYDLTERMLPARILALPTPTEADSRRFLLERGARYHGVGTARDLMDYFRLSISVSRPQLRELVEEGVLIPVRVEGWKEQAYLHSQARLPRSINARALLSPFDPVVWERKRIELLFGFDYRIEIYTPSPKRRFGYYVLPFLLGDELVARADLKADRQRGALVCHAAYGELGRDPSTIAPELLAELRLMAGWLGLERVEIGARGDLAPALKRASGKAK